MKTETADEGSFSALLVDFDGVIRQWPSTDTSIETKHGLDIGSIRSAAFNPELLDPAIRGIINDEKWRTTVADYLQSQQPNSDATSAINEWSAGSGEIDADVLELLSACKSRTEILLLTNATSRLSEDLAVLGLDNWFTKVLNSSDLGIIKPEPEIFKTAIMACDCSIDEIVYIDDSLSNTIAAANAGILTHRYTSLNSCKQFLSDIGLLG